MRIALAPGAFFDGKRRPTPMHGHASPGGAFPNSLWDATAIPQVPGVPLAGSVRADVVVIGAGFTGLSAALHLAERGTSVRVLDAGDAGSGTSGRAGGQVIAGYHRDPDVLRAVHGDDIGERMTRFGGGAPDLVFALIKRHSIDCRPLRAGWIQAAFGESELPTLHRRAEMWARLGAPVECLDRAAIAALLGTGEYAGGWLDKRGGTVQPLSYARGLAHAAAAAGAALHYRTKALRLRRKRRQWKVETAGAAVVADAVLICTNAHTGGLWPRLRGTIMPAHSVQIATAPLSAAARRTVLPGGHCCADTRVLLRYFRLDEAGRLVIGGPGPLWRPRGIRAWSFSALARSIRRLFPQIESPRFEFHWYGRGALTWDMPPHLYEPAPGLLAALGYNGRGIAMGTALGALLARRLHGEPPASLPFPVSRLSALPLGPLRGVYAGVLTLLSHLRAG